MSIDVISRPSDPPSIASLYESQRYEELISALRDAMAEDARIVTEPVVKEWIARRWRNLFVTTASQDPQALRQSTGGIRVMRRILDDQDPRQRVAQRFLVDPSEEDWADDLPAAPMSPLRKSTVVFGPGLLNGMIPVRALAKAFVDLEKHHEWPFLRVDAHPLRSCDANIADYVALLEEGIGRGPGGHKVQVDPPEEVIFLVYSKGASDILRFLIARPDLAARIRAVFSWAGSYGGSWVADEAWEQFGEIELLGTARKLPPAAVGVLKQFSPLVSINPEGLDRVQETDVMGAMRDLTTKVSDEFLAQHAAALDALNIPFFTLAGSTDSKHVPTLQAEAFLKLSARGDLNDMQLTRSQTSLDIPMATQFGAVRAHHWDIAFEAFPGMARALSTNLRNPFPSKRAVVAMVQLAIELGLAR